METTDRPAPRRAVVAVVGNARLDDDEAVVEARRLGSALIDAGFRIVTGGLGGVMEEVSRGARTSPSWTEGSVLGIVPSYRAADANPWCDVVIPTGMQMGRNILVVASADVVIAVGGGSGTLSELAIAWQLGKPIVALGTRGWAGRLAGQVIDARSDEPVHTAHDVDEAIRLCSAFASEARSAGDIGSGWRHGARGG